MQLENPGRTRRRHHIEPPAVPNDPGSMPATEPAREPAAPAAPTPDREPVPA